MSEFDEPDALHDPKTPDETIRALDFHASANLHPAEAVAELTVRADTASSLGAEWVREDFWGRAPMTVVFGTAGFVDVSYSTRR